VSPRTLAGRVSLVQSVLTVVALAAVVVGTSFAVTGLLQRKRDAALGETAGRAAELANALGAYALDAEWMERELSELRPSEVRVEFQDPTGFALAASGPGAALGKSRIGCHDHAALRVCAAEAGLFTVAAAADRSGDAEEHDQLLSALLAVAVLAALLVGIASRHIARRALAPLTDLTARVASIEPERGGRLGTPIEFAELELLRLRFDELLGRFGAALSREKRLTAQASHELRTPLAVARAEIEELSDAGNGEQGYGRAIAALDRLSELVQALLWFARAEERLDDDRIGIVNLADVVRAQVAECERLHPGRAMASALPDELLVRGDEHLLGLATANLIENAFKHAACGEIAVSVEVGTASLCLCVTNLGTLPPDVERLFEPFQRGAAADVAGFGLGLPLARGIARAHGGDVELEASAGAVTCLLALPVVDWSDDEPFRFRSKTSDSGRLRNERSPS
jgi:signal transduction histidine kinase